MPLTERIVQWTMRILDRSPSALERCLLIAIEEHMSTDARAILREQLVHMNRVQRLVGGKEVDFYRMYRGKPYYQDLRPFPFGDPEAKLATIKFSCPGIPQEFQAEFWLVNGRLFSITFKQSPKRIRNRADINVLGVTMHIDPMQPGLDESKIAETAPLDATELQGWLQDWVNRFPVGKVTSPLPTEVIERKLRELDAVLPVDFRELQYQTNGMILGQTTILGIDEVYRVVLEDAEYYLLAESHEQPEPYFFMVREGTTDQTIYFCGHDEDERHNVGTSFRRAIEEHLERYYQRT